jgi:iron complex outermembrane receptor protein
MSSLHRRYLLILLPALLGTLNLSAQTAPTTTETPANAEEKPLELSVFEVTTSEDNGYQSPNTAEVLRMNTAIENVPMNVTIFNQNFIEDLMATDTSQLLAYEASAVKTTENDGFLLRGSSSAGANFLDGFSQTTGNGSQPLANVERVEVIRGPAAVLYGGGGYGGTINRITKQPKPKASASMRLMARDTTAYRGEFDLNTGAFGPGKKFFFRVNGVYESGDTWFGQHKAERSIAPSLSWQITDKTKLTFQYFWNYIETQGSWETPVHAGNPLGMYTGDGVWHEMPRKINWNGNFNHPDKDLEYRHQTRNVANYNFTHTFNRHFYFRSQFQWEDKKQRIYETQALSASLTILKDAALMPRGLRNLPVDTVNYRARNELVVEGNTGPLHHRLLLGHGWTTQDDNNRAILATRSTGGITNAAALNGNGLIADATTAATSIQKFYNFFPDITYAQFLADPRIAGFNPRTYMPINLFDRENEGPAWIGTERPLEILNTHTDVVNETNDFYVNDVFSLFKERFFVMAGTRFAENKRRTKTFVTGTFPNKVYNSNPTPVKVSAESPTYSVGAVWHLNSAKTWSLYGNANTAFAPNYQLQPDGSSLDPETGNQKEIGLRTSLMSGRILFLLAYFELQQDNVARADPARPGEGWFIQENGAFSKGWELTWNTRVTDNWLVTGGFSDTTAYNKRTGLVQALMPKHRFSIFNRYSFESGPLKGLNLNLGAIYTGVRPQTRTTERNEPAWHVPNWWRFDFIAGYNFKPKNSRYRYSLSMSVTNVLDNREIYYVASNSRFTLDPGRVGSVALGVRF